MDVDETITISGPILGAVLKAGGAVSCALVRKSEIECGGDLVVTNEIVDSKVKAGGEYQVDLSRGPYRQQRPDRGPWDRDRIPSLQGEKPQPGDSGSERYFRSDPGGGIGGIDQKPRELKRSPGPGGIRTQGPGREWHRTKDPGLAEQIRQKGAVLKELRAKLEEAAARIKGGRKGGRPGRG